MFFNGQKFLIARFLLILFLLVGTFGMNPVYQVHAASVGLDRSTGDGIPLYSIPAAGLPPGQPVLMQPANGATNLSTSPTLQVRVTDPDAQALNVSFYGRSAGAGGGNDFSLIVLPDTQSYPANNPEIFDSQTQWIADHKTTSNIAFVTHVGDIVATASSTMEYINADASMDILDAANVSYSVGPGNHDYPLTKYNTYFGVSRFSGKSYYGGHYGIGNENNYSLFSASGMDFLLINLEYQPSPAVLDWADALLKAHSTRRAIVSSHDIIDTDSEWSDYGLYDALQDNPNLFLMVSGHMHSPTDGAGMRTETGENGNTIYLVMADYQDFENGGNGFLRIMRFSPANDTIYVQTYSPYLDDYLMDEENQFDLPYDMTYSSGYVSLGTVNGVVSGGNASLIWPGLDTNKQYEWYTVASDGTLQTTSSTWAFTTGSTPPTCYPLTLSHTGQGSNPTASPLKSAACATNGQYVYGAAITLGGVVPSTGWQIGSWTGTANDGSTASTNSLTMPASARTVSVNYTQTEYTLAIASAQGTVTKNPDKPTYHHGDIVQLTGIPAMGWSFSNWTGDMTGTNNPGSIIINGNESVTANYSQICYALTLSHTGQGSNPTASPLKSTACSSNGQYVYGAAITLNGAAPSTGWQIGSWTGTNTDSSTAATNTLTMSASARTVSVNYTQIGYTVAVTSAHGTVIKNPDKPTYNQGDIVQLTSLPSTGWAFANWSGDATGTNNPVSVTVNGNKAITANYIQTEYALAITSAHGSVTKNPDKATYHFGEVVELTVVPAAGWHFVNWTGDATGADNPVSVTINGNTAVTANYSQVGYTLTTASDHGTVTTSPDKATYGYGEVVQLKATADHDWLFVNWTGDVTGTMNPISVTMNSSKTLTANFMRRGADTTGVFRPSNGALYLKNQNMTGYADIQINYGLGGDYPIVGDWDGDGTATIGIWRNGSFYLRNANTIGIADVVFAFGLPGDQPVAGDWDGDGVDTIGIYRNGLFLLRNSNSAGPADMTFALGVARDIGIAGDWDGDGKDTTGVFRPSNGALYLKNTNVTGFANVQINYGLGGDMPVVGDWDNNGTDTIGVYRRGTFMLRNSNTIGVAEVVFALGVPGDMPIAGNWDGIP